MKFARIRRDLKVFNKTSVNVYKFLTQKSACFRVFLRKKCPFNIDNLFVNTYNISIEREVLT